VRYRRAFHRRRGSLEADLTGPGFHLDRRDRLVLESKESMAKRGVASPDDGDALSLTFAQPGGWEMRPRRAGRRLKPGWTEHATNGGH
jgi:hypothetical protein